jgi:hypothetical protein
MSGVIKRGKYIDGNFSFVLREEFARISSKTGKKLMPT